MDDENYREVLYDKYCMTCQFADKGSNEQPCDACLSEPINLYSEKPIKYKNYEEDK